MRNQIFLKNALIALIVRSLGAISLVLMNLMVTRNLSLNDSGLFFLAFSIFTAVGLFCTMGFTHAFLRFIGGFHKEGNWSGIKGVVFIGLKLSMLTTLVFGSIIYGFADTLSVSFFLKPELTIFIQIIFIGLPAFVCLQLLAFFFQAINETSKSITLINISVTILVIAFMLLVLTLGYSLNSKLISYIFLLSVLLTFVLSTTWWFQHAKPDIKPDYSVSSELMKSSRSLWVMVITSLFIQYAGQIIIGKYSSSEDVALYSIAQRISMLTSFALIAINLVAAPKFASITQRIDTKELRKISLFCSRLMLAISIPMFVCLLSFPRFILSFFGAEYIEADLILQVLVVGQFIYVMSGSVYFLLNMTGHEYEMKNIMIFSGVLALVLLLWLTPLYGPLGAAVATSLSIASQNLIAVYFVKKRLGINTLNILNQ
jgi:O-antigen/teichoic acid export membrane protein